MVHCINRVLLKGGLDWKTEWKTEWKAELKNGMENGIENAKVVTNPYIFNDFFPKYTLSVSFTFGGNVQQCLVTGTGFLGWC